MAPEISVVMAVYNTEFTMLRQAIQSILDQTFTDFEFVIVLDCPTDGSDAVVREYANADARIRIVQNPENMGLAYSLHTGVSCARGRYIARMDSDDIALPERFQVQYDYMQAHPEVVVLGSRVIPFGEGLEAPFAVQSDWVADMELLKIRMLFRNVGVPHPTAMIRKSTLDAHGINYTQSFRKSQDYRLWADLMQVGRIVMLPQILLRYRIHPNQISAKWQALNEYGRQTVQLQLKQLVEEVSEKELALHYSAYDPELPEEDVRGFSRYLTKISQSNQQKRLYHQGKLDAELRYMWCKKAIRRAIRLKKPDMLLHGRMLSIFRPRVLSLYLQNLRNKKQYLQAMQAFEAAQVPGAGNTP